MIICNKCSEKSFPYEETNNGTCIACNGGETDRPTRLKVAIDKMTSKRQEYQYKHHASVDESDKEAIYINYFFSQNYPDDVEDESLAN